MFYPESKKALNIKKAINRPAQLHKDLGISTNKKIPASKIRAAANRTGKVGQRARFALTLNKLRSR